MNKHEKFDLETFLSGLQLEHSVKQKLLKVLKKVGLTTADSLRSLSDDDYKELGKRNELNGTIGVISAFKEFVKNELPHKRPESCQLTFSLTHEQASWYSKKTFFWTFVAWYKNEDNKEIVIAGHSTVQEPDSGINENELKQHERGRHITTLESPNIEKESIVLPLKIRTTETMEVHYEAILWQHTSPETTAAIKKVFTSDGLQEVDKKIESLVEKRQLEIEKAADETWKSFQEVSKGVGKVLPEPYSKGVELGTSAVELFRHLVKLIKASKDYCFVGTTRAVFYVHRTPDSKFHMTNSGLKKTTGEEVELSTEKFVKWKLTVTSPKHKLSKTTKKIYGSFEVKLESLVEEDEDDEEEETSTTSNRNDTQDPKQPGTPRTPKSEKKKKKKKKKIMMKKKQAFYWL